MKPPSEYLRAASRHSLLGCPPCVLVAEDSFPKTADSRAYRGWQQAQPRSPVSTVHLLRPLPGWRGYASTPPDFPLRNVERLCFSHAAPPETGWPPLKHQHHGPFGPTPLQSPLPYYEPFCPCAL